MSASSPHPTGDRPPAPRTRTLALQGVANRVVRGLLRTPLVGRIVGRRLITVYAVGRRTGRRYAVPVACTRDGGDLLFGTSFRWARNLRTGEPVDIRLRGRRVSVAVEVVTGEAGVVEQYAIIARDNHRFAAFNGIGFAGDGSPDPDDLHLAWATGARAFRLTPP